MIVIVLALTISVGQELREGLAKQFWLRSLMSL